MLSVEWPHDAMVESGSEPCVGRLTMTGFAVDRESRLLMVGIGGLVIIGPVTIDTVGGSAGVPSVGMTQGAICNFMLSAQWPNQIVVEGGA